MHASQLHLLEGGRHALSAERLRQLRHLRAVLDRVSRQLTDQVIQLCQVRAVLQKCIVVFILRAFIYVVEFELAHVELWHLL